MDDHEVFHLREQVLTLVRLDRLGIAGSTARTRQAHLRHRHWRGQPPFGLAVDSLMGEEELVIKALEDRSGHFSARQRRFDSWRWNRRA